LLRFSKCLIRRRGSESSMPQQPFLTFGPAGTEVARNGEPPRLGRKAKGTLHTRHSPLILPSLPKSFYLTHYRDTPHFKTLDISKLNTEAAQPKFSNAASSANNAVKQGYLVPSTKGQRQLSAAGERFVAALPDREEARKAMSLSAPRRKSRRAKSSKSSRAAETKT
jgi:hypothetical protein